MVITITDVVYTDMFHDCNEHFIEWSCTKLPFIVSNIQSSDFKEKNRETVFEELSFNDREVLFSFNIAV